MVAVQLILEVHTGVDLLIHHLGPKTGGGNLLAQRRFLLAGLSPEQILHRGNQTGKTGGSRFLPIRVRNLSHRLPVIVRLGFRLLRLCSFRGGRNGFRYRFLRGLHLRRLCGFLSLLQPGNRVCLRFRGHLFPFAHRLLRQSLLLCCRPGRFCLRKHSRLHALCLRDGCRLGRCLRNCRRLGRSFRLWIRCSFCGCFRLRNRRPFCSCFRLRNYRPFCSCFRLRNRRPFCGCFRLRNRRPFCSCSRLRNRLGFRGRNCLFLLRAYQGKLHPLFPRVGRKQKSAPQIPRKPAALCSVHRHIPGRLRPFLLRRRPHPVFLDHQRVVNVLPLFPLGIVHRHPVVHPYEAPVLHPEVLLFLLPVLRHLSQHTAPRFSWGHFLRERSPGNLRRLASHGLLRPYLHRRHLHRHKHCQDPRQNPQPRFPHFSLPLFFLFLPMIPAFLSCPICFSLKPSLLLELYHLFHILST